MARFCECNIAANFPITKEGIISVSLRTNQEVVIMQTACGTSVALTAGTKGDLSITAYADVPSERPGQPGALTCPGNAGVSFNWDQRTECTSIGTNVHVIPRGGARSYKEGDVTSRVTKFIETDRSGSINASAASGPHTPYFNTERSNGYGFTYTGEPIQISPADSSGQKTVSFLSNIISAEMYLMNFSWTYTPPNVPTVSYSFMVVYN
jgi:hypothetical protein